MSVADADGNPASGLTKENFGLVKFGAGQPAQLISEWAVQNPLGLHGSESVPGFYVLEIDRSIPTIEFDMPTAEMLGLTVQRGGTFQLHERGQTIFKVSYQKQ